MNYTVSELAKTKTVCNVRFGELFILLGDDIEAPTVFMRIEDEPDSDQIRSVSIGTGEIMVLGMYAEVIQMEPVTKPTFRRVRV